jgi:hypothetical protein
MVHESNNYIQSTWPASTEANVISGRFAVLIGGLGNLEAPEEYGLVLIHCGGRQRGPLLRL